MKEIRRKIIKMLGRNYYVYIMTNEYHNVLYIGMTNDLVRRVYEHKNGVVKGFTKKYRVHKLVWYESGHDVESVIAREKQLKNWNRAKKNVLIERMNPEWKDLSI